MEPTTIKRDFFIQRLEKRGVAQIGCLCRILALTRMCAQWNEKM
jgi:hypothetical protein